MKTKTKALLSAALVVGGVLATSVPAQAATDTYDCWPGPNHSGCAWGDNGLYSSSDGGAAAAGEIDWRSNDGVMLVYGQMTDIKADGRGPWIQVEFDDRDGSYTIKSQHFNIGNTGVGDINLGYGNHNSADLDDTNAVWLRICNGGATPQNCGPWKGPWHRF